MALKVLHIVSALSGGGVERSILSSSRIIAEKGIAFDFTVFTDKVGMLEDDAADGGSKIYHIPSKRENYILFLKSVRSIMKNGDYDIVHCHLAEKGFWFYYFAKKYGKKCIMHTHGCHLEQSFFQKLKKQVLLILSARYCDWFCSCSIASAKYVFGQDYKKSEVIDNAIDIQNFLFSQADRNEMRKSCGIADGDFLIGTVGRQVSEKNQAFLIKTMPELLENRKGVKLMLVGNGELKNELQSLAESLNVSEAVIFTGNVKNPEGYYSAFDAFALPSISEGLGMALLEAQINGLKCFVSDCITDEAIINNEKVVKIPLKYREKWIKELENAESGYERAVNLSDFEQFSAENAAEKLVEIYDKLV